MESLALLFLRIGLGLTFCLTGYYILSEKSHWTGMISPWVKKLLPVAPTQFMLIVGVYDIINGLWLLTGIYVWLAALLAALHLVLVLIAAGITDVTYRDIGLLCASITLMLVTWPLDIFRTLWP